MRSDYDDPAAVAPQCIELFKTQSDALLCVAKHFIENSFWREGIAEYYKDVPQDEMLRAEIERNKEKWLSFAKWEEGPEACDWAYFIEQYTIQ